MWESKNTTNTWSKVSQRRSKCSQSPPKYHRHSGAVQLMWESFQIPQKELSGTHLSLFGRQFHASALPSVGQLRRGYPTHVMWELQAVLSTNPAWLMIRFSPSSFSFLPSPLNIKHTLLPFPIPKLLFVFFVVEFSWVSIGCFLLYNICK